MVPGSKIILGPGMAITFWYDFSSSYSYLSAMRIEALSKAASIDVLWQPFLLGPIFQDAGYGGSPNLIAPAKAAYMWADIGRRASSRGIGFVRPEVFPQRSIAAARAVLGLSADDRPAFTRAVFCETFVNGRDIAEPDVIASAARAAGLDPAQILANTSIPAIKQELFSAVERAKAHGIFGAPSFTTSDGTLFWGDDRLDDAFLWERSPH